MTRPGLSFTKNREPFAFMRTARSLVVDYVNRRGFIDEEDFTEVDVHIIWFTTSANDNEWRILMGTTLPDGLYYRVSHNGKETRLDVFKMFDTETISVKDNN